LQRTNNLLLSVCFPKKELAAFCILKQKKAAATCRLLIVVQSMVKNSRYASSGAAGR
jgi:hypothetical protein